LLVNIIARRFVTRAERKQSAIRPFVDEELVVSTATAGG
jgi:hypothetical protein